MADEKQVARDDIYTAMARVWADVGYVQKEKAKGLPYTFVSETGLIEAIRPAFVEEGIVVHPVSTLLLGTDTYETARGTVMHSRIVEIIFRFYHSPSGTFFDAPGIGEGADAGDKAVYKAHTGAYKYALRQSMMIATGDDPDQTSSDEQARRPRSLPPIAKGDPQTVIRSLENVGPLTKKEGSKFKGHMLGTLARGDRQSFEWLCENWPGPETKAHAVRLRGMYEEHGWPMTVEEESEAAGPKVGSGNTPMTTTGSGTQDTPATTETPDPKADGTQAVATTTTPKSSTSSDTLEDTLVSELPRPTATELGCGILYRALGKQYPGFEPPETFIKDGLWKDGGNPKLVGHISKWFMNEDPVDIATPPVEKIKQMKATDAFDLLQELGARDAVLEIIPRRVELFWPDTPEDEVDAKIAKWLSNKYKDAHDMKRGWRNWKKAVIQDLTPTEIVALHKSLGLVQNPFEEKEAEADIGDVLEMFGD